MTNKLMKSIIYAIVTGAEQMKSKRRKKKKKKSDSSREQQSRDSDISNTGKKRLTDKNDTDTGYRNRAIGIK